jgi:hypothetical protein
MVDRISIGGVLQTIRDLGWSPGAIIDIGVSMGTDGLYDVWPDAPLCLIDPVPENRPYMEKIASSYPNVQIFNVGASNATGKMPGRVAENGQAVLGHQVASGIFGWLRSRPVGNWRRY